jgi:general secretion pathway protein E
MNTKTDVRSPMTEKELAQSLVQAGLLTSQQVRNAAQQLGKGESFAQIIVKEGYVSMMDVLKIDPLIFQIVHTPRAVPTVNGGNEANGMCEFAPREKLHDPPRSFQPAPNPLSPDTGVDTNGSDSQRSKVTRQNGHHNGHLAVSANGSANGVNGSLTTPVVALDNAASKLNSTALFAGMNSIQDGQHEAPEPDQGSVRIIGEDVPVERGANAIVDYCNQILQYAVKLRASDVHLEPRSSGLLARFRVDGHLQPAPGGPLPSSVQAPIISRLKLLANLNIAETRLPQDGRFRAEIDGRIIDFRVATLPCLHGEQLVLRLLNHSAQVPDLAELGFSKEAGSAFEAMLRRSCSMILVTGPTGSGKTTTLYAALASTRDDTKKVVTVEDPVEYEMDGITQTHVQAKIGLTFATQLRSILRHDPDVIMVGEIRDGETADVAVRAALTGHLVLSTLHTNSASAAVTRLQDMDVPSFLIASTLSGVLAQRLVRLICRHCRQQLPSDSPEYALHRDTLRLPDGTSLYFGAGCPACNDTGFQGRIALIEVLHVNQEIRRGIMGKVDSDSLRRMAVEHGMKTLWQDGLDKLTRGLTTAEEVARALLGTEDIAYEQAVLH